jgi:Intracellular proteinase inhibitor
LVERAVHTAIVGAAIVFALATPPAGADGVATWKHCRVPSMDVTPVPPQRGGAVELDVRPAGNLVSGRPVDWHFTVTNLGASPVRMVFPTAQFGDVILRPARQGALDSFRDDAVYRWSANKAFAQFVTPAVLPPHSSWQCSLGPSTLEAPGRYLLIAYVTARTQSAARAGSITLRRYVDVARGP